MTGVKTRRPSPLQRRVLIVLAALGAKRPGPVATRDIERVLEQGGDAPVYGPNLRASCRRMEAAGWLRTLRAPNMQLAVELTDAGRALAAPLLADEQARVLAEQRATAVRVLPLVPHSKADEADDRPVALDDRWHIACRGDYVIRLDGTTCLQLWNTAGQLTRLEGDPLLVAAWLQACHDAGIAFRVQINESAAPEEGSPDGTEPADLTDTWYRQLDTALQALGITGLTEDIRLAVVSPEASLRMLPAPARLLHVLRDADPLTAATYEEDTEAALAELLTRAGFTGDQAQELQWHRIRWPLMDQEEADRRELNSLLDELEQRQLYCNRGQLTEIVFSPVRKPGERWTERLQWLLMTDAFGFRSPQSRDAGARALAILAGYTGQEVADHLARVIVWNDAGAVAGTSSFPRPHEE
jgi:DNA-binding MarR family transcriptional regulator